MPKLIFTMVGTSLLEKEKELLEGEREYKKEVADSSLHTISNWLIDIFQVLNGEASRESELEEKILARLPRGDPDQLTKMQKNKLSAEIASLYKLGLTSEDTLYLLCSQTPESAFCARINAKFLIQKEKQPDTKCNIEETIKEMVSSEKIKVVEGLKVEGNDAATNFQTKGVKNLVGFVSKKVKEEGKGHSIIFNITGGYKGVVPYLALLGMCLKGIEVKYLYEESEEIITLPKLPIAFDLFTWRDYRGFIYSVPYLKEKAKIILEKVLPEEISRFFEETTYELTPFGEIFDEKYREEKISLTPFGRGHLLTEKITDPDKQKALRNCIARWQHLWVGDLIPETVEHARGHTQRDLELAAQMISPILEVENDFFGDSTKNDDSLLVLLSSIWLHDLGHSGSYIKWKNIEESEARSYDIAGFPSLVRDIHHLLSWYLIGQDKNKLFKSRGANDKWRRDESIFSDELIEAIGKACLYHRGEMPASNGQKPYEHIGIKITKPLEELTSNKVNLPLIGALLRMADAGEVQSERTVSDEYEKMREIQNKRECDRLRVEEEEYRNMILDSNNLPWYLAFAKETSRKYFNWGHRNDFPINNDFQNLGISNKKKKYLEEEEDEGRYKDTYLDYVVDVCTQKFIQEEELNEIDAKDKLILRNWLSTLNQYIFKKRQPAHFEKHKGIIAMMYLLDKITNKDDKNEYHFKVLAIHRKNKDQNETNKFVQNTEKVLTEDIKKEYKKVASILNKNRIYLDSAHRMEEGNREIVLVWPKEDAT